MKPNEGSISLVRSTRSVVVKPKPNQTTNQAATQIENKPGGLKTNQAARQTQNQSIRLPRRDKRNQSTVESKQPRRVFILFNVCPPERERVNHLLQGKRNCSFPGRVLYNTLPKPTKGVID